MVRGDDGWWTAPVGPAHGTRLRLLVDGSDPLPDPRSPWQPDGVHGREPDVRHRAAHLGRRRRGPAATSAAPSSTSSTSAPSPRRAPSTPRSTDLAHLADLGVDVVELMPVAAFPGAHGWGYDGVALYAVHEAYGGPAALQRFVDAAHARGHRGLPRRGLQPPRAVRELPDAVRPVLHRHPPHPVGLGGQPRRPGRRGAGVHRRQRRALAAGLPRGRAAPRRRARAGRRLRAATCSPSCPTPWPTSPAGSAGRCRSSRSPTSTTRRWSPRPPRAASA